MKALLDTHAFLWALAGDERMSRLARDTFAGPAGLSLSIASVWEILIRVTVAQAETASACRSVRAQKIAGELDRDPPHQHRPFARLRASPDASPRSVRSHVDCAEPGGEPSDRYLRSVVCPLRRSADLVARLRLWPLARP
jgi:hypothetical protein